jgi:hypothetical protein
MKFFIYLAVLTISFSSVLNTNSNSKSSNSVSSQTEMTFTTSNAVPQSTKLMESVIISRPVQVKARMNGIDIKSENTMFFSSGDLYLNGKNEPELGARFKQSEEEIKNMVAPEIRSRKKLNSEVQESNETYRQNFLQIHDNIQLESKLLKSFKNTLDRYISPKETEIVSVTNVDQITMSNDQLRK